jgi:hypothetical protein
MYCYNRYTLTRTRTQRKWSVGTCCAQVFPMKTNERFIANTIRIYVHTHTHTRTHTHTHTHTHPSKRRHAGEGGGGHGRHRWCQWCTHWCGRSSQQGTSNTHPRGISIPGLNNTWAWPPRSRSGSRSVSTAPEMPASLRPQPTDALGLDPVSPPSLWICIHICMYLSLPPSPCPSVYLSLSLSRARARALSLPAGLTIRNTTDWGGRGKDEETSAEAYVYRCFNDD